MQKTFDNNGVRILLNRTQEFEITDSVVKFDNGIAYPDDAEEDDKILVNRCLNFAALEQTISMMELIAINFTEKEDKEGAEFAINISTFLRNISEGIAYDIIKTKHDMDSDNILNSILNS